MIRRRGIGRIDPRWSLLCWWRGHDFGQEYDPVRNIWFVPGEATRCRRRGCEQWMRWVIR